MRVTGVTVSRSIWRAGLSLLILLGLTGTKAEAFPRTHHEDADVVARSELIVVARMEGGSIRREDFRTEPSGGVAYRHHATVIITEVLKGSFPAQIARRSTNQALQRM